MHYDRDHKTYLDFGNHTEKVKKSCMNHPIENPIYLYNRNFHDRKLNMKIYYIFDSPGSVSHRIWERDKGDR